MIIGMSADRPCAITVAGASGSSAVPYAGKPNAGIAPDASNRSAVSARRHAASAQPSRSAHVVPVASTWASGANGAYSGTPGASPLAGKRTEHDPLCTIALSNSALAPGEVASAHV